MSQRGVFLAGGGGGGTVITLEGNTGGKVGPDGTGNIDVVGTGSITVTGTPGSNTLTISSSGGGGGIQTITGNSGGPIGPDGGGNVDFETANTNVEIVGTANTLTMDFAVTTNLFIGVDGSTVTTGTENVSLGSLALDSVTAGAGNTCLGVECGQLINSGNYNSSVGWNSLRQLSAGSQNCAFGVNSLFSLLAGSSNVALGTNSAANYTGSESNNICIGDLQQGVVGESNVMRLGSTQTSAYMAGVSGVSVSNLNLVTVNTVTGQLGSQAAPAANSVYFVASLTAIQTNATGDGTLFTIPFNAASVNVGGAFNTGTGAFTAPTTGVYFFNVNMYVQSLTAAIYTIGYAQFDVNAGTTSYLFLDSNFSAVADANMNLVVNASQIISLTAGDVVIAQVGVIGGPKTVNIFGGATSSPTNFSGYQIA